MLIQQGTNEYGIYAYGNNLIGIYKNMHNGKPYTGKNTEYVFCNDCGKIIGTAMGGFRRHAAACKESDGKWLKSKVQQMHDSYNWGSLNPEDTKIYKALKHKAKSLYNFEPEYNCPA